MKTSEYRVSLGILEFQPQLFLIHPFYRKTVFIWPKNVPMVRKLGGKRVDVNFIGMLEEYLSWDVYKILFF